MNIFLARYEPDKLGGGWSWSRNFAKCFDLSSYEEADVYMIPSASMITTADVEKAKSDGKKVVLRVDNITRNSRNKRNGMDRMKTKAEMADYVVYQSEFARDLLQPYLKVFNQSVIMNSSDESVFNDKDRNSDGNTYMYSRYNRDETKNFEVARFHFSQIFSSNPDANLILVGQYSPELTTNDFDFYMGEQYEYIGVVQDAEYMAQLYRTTDELIYTYWQDACSNTLIEARLCGCKIDFVDQFFLKGSASEIMSKPLDYFHLDRMKREYQKVFDEVCSG